VEITSATAMWYHSWMPPLPIRWVLVRDPQGKFEPQALRGTDVTVDPVRMLEWFVRRWRLEVTWQEARTHLGLETQRQWNALAIARTTPALLGLFSSVTRLTGQRAQAPALPVRQAVWYRQPQLNGHIDRTTSLESCYTWYRIREGCSPRPSCAA
jgi:hypothetical protein